MFTINETEFGWDEIVAAAQVWGEWDQLIAEARQGLACFKRAAAANEWPAKADVQSAANQFRYKHNLISGQETQSWLEHWELTVDEWMSYFRRSLLRRQWADQSNAIVTEHRAGSEEIESVLKCEAVCSGKFAEWTKRLAGRAAIASQSGSLDSGRHLGCASPRDLVARIEAGFEQVRCQTVTPQRLKDKISDHLLDWVRFDCRYIWFADERVAREAAWCVTEDGLTLDQVAGDARSAVRQWNFYLDEIDSSARPCFLAARQGDWLGPVKMKDGFPLFSIIAKQMPAESDPQIRQRAEQAIVGNLMEQAMNDRVKWIKLM